MHDTRRHERIFLLTASRSSLFFLGEITKFIGGENITRVVSDKKVLRNAKDLTAEQAIYKAFPDVKDNEEFGVTACGEHLLVRRFKAE